MKKIGKLAKKIYKSGELLGAWATFGAFLLAMWAYFFSNIPEQLTQKFNNEIASLHEDVVDLKKEKRSLANDLESERTKFSEMNKRNTELVENLNQRKSDLERTIANYNVQITELEKNLEELKNQNALNLKYKNKYLADTISSYVSFFAINYVGGDYYERLSDAKKARDYVEWKEFIRLIGDNANTPLIFKIFIKAENIDFKRVPKGWQISVYQIHGKTYSEALEKLQKEDSLFREKISQRIEPQTIGDAITNLTASIIETQIKDMPLRDRNLIAGAQKKFYKIHQTDLSKSIVLNIPLSASAQEVAKKGKEISENLQLMEDLLFSMMEEMSESLLKENANRNNSTR